MSKKNCLTTLDDECLKLVIAILRRQVSVQEQSWQITHSIHERKMADWSVRANGLNIIAFLKLERELADSYDHVKEAKREWGAVHQQLMAAEAEWSERHPVLV